ncbi:MAG: YbaN family protein [Prevotellaceae bacterium]|nr:YbaN family protein [Prevotellaceae bacterium]
MKILLAVLGLISLGLGVLGIFLPVLPTTPFFLLSAALFARSSKKLYDWLLNHPVMGEYIRNFIEDKSIPLKVKIVSISVMWISMLCTAFLAVNDKLWLQILLIAIAVGVTIHILSFKTRKKAD